ncbi:hypothetical protein FB451DRAFT_1373676 [Mycena latifolia]|nr:hypothetical protein FB451DRAFT_1373676 [Mycena latifolia]
MTATRRHAAWNQRCKVDAEEKKARRGVPVNPPAGVGVKVSKLLKTESADSDAQGTADNACMIHDEEKPRIQRRYSSGPASLGPAAIEQWRSGQGECRKEAKTLGHHASWIVPPALEPPPPDLPRRRSSAKTWPRPCTLRKTLYLRGELSSGQPVEPRLMLHRAQERGEVEQVANVQVPMGVLSMSGAFIVWGSMNCPAPPALRTSNWAENRRALGRNASREQRRSIRVSCTAPVIGGTYNSLRQPPRPLASRFRFKTETRLSRLLPHHHGLNVPPTSVLAHRIAPESPTASAYHLCFPVLTSTIPSGSSSTSTTRFAVRFASTPLYIYGGREGFSYPLQWHRTLLSAARRRTPHTPGSRGGERVQHEARCQEALVECTQSTSVFLVRIAEHETETLPVWESYQYKMKVERDDLRQNPHGPSAGYVPIRSDGLGQLKLKPSLQGPRRSISREISFHSAALSAHGVKTSQRAPHPICRAYERWDAVIDHLRADLRTLLACALVCPQQSQSTLKTRLRF